MTGRPGRERAWAGSNSEKARHRQQREREPTRHRKPTGKDRWGLTDSSSATEAGEVKPGTQRKLHRQPLFAGARG